MKTKQTEASVENFLNKITDENVQRDSQKIAEMMEAATGAKPKMWGENIVGCGLRTLKYSTGREVEWLEIGFSPRKANLTLYLNMGEGWDEDLLAKIGKHKIGKGCLYFKRLSDINEDILGKLIEKSVKNIRRN